MLNKVKNLLANRGIQVLLVLILYLSFAGSMPEFGHQLLYTISTLIKDIIIWIIPFTIAFFISHTINSFKKSAPLFILTIMGFEAFSNFCSVWYAFAAANSIADFNTNFAAAETSSNFAVLWRLPFTKPAWWSPQNACIVGAVLGCIGAFYRSLWLQNFIEQGKNVVEVILTKGIARLIPLYILGFVAEAHQKSLISNMVSHYPVLLSWLLLFLTLYILLLFAVGNGFSLKNTLKSIKNILPAVGIATCSGCSLSTMPWTIEGTAKNLRNPKLAQAVIPATTNIQMIGDCLMNAFLLTLLFKQFNGYVPDLWTWLSFSLIYVLARFATAAVLGGAFFLMMPIYEQYLGFTPEMLAILLAFNVILDPIVTIGNVTCNAALCRVFEIVWTPIQNTAQLLVRSNKVKPSKPAVENSDIA